MLAATSQAQLLEGYRSPVRVGWRLFSRCLPTIAAYSAPLAIALGLGSVLIPMDENGGVAGNWPVVIAMVALIVYTIAFVQTIVTWEHTGARQGNLFAFVLRGLPRWLTTVVLMLAATFVGFFLLVVPGIYISLRVFWADEYALQHRANPVEALRDSWVLTQSQAMPIFIFQFLTGVAGYAVILVGILLMVPVVAWIDRVPAIGEMIGNTLLYWFVMLVYAGLHAPEVAYFYGMKAKKQATAMAKAASQQA